MSKSLVEQEDDDIEKAIALSLQTTQPNVSPTAAKQEVIDLDSDASTTDDDGGPPSMGVPPTTKMQSPQPISAARASGMLGLDRKAMEQERLARKRKASISPSPTRKTLKSEPPTTTAQVDTTVEVTSSNRLRNLPYANGAVKKTWAFGHSREEDIKLEEVLQKNDLTLAVLSSFQWDVDWLLRKIDTKTTQLVFVMQADNDEIKAQYKRETATMPNLRLCFPSMEGQINCMHSKLMLLSHPTHLRVAVPTANLVPYDWGETGIMENTTFLIDLPRLSTERAVAADDGMTNFGRDLSYFLQAMGLEQSIIESLHHFDFSATKGLAFVHTVGGAHAGHDEPWRRTGYCGLGRAISDLGLASDEPLNIDYVTSSVGSLNMDFVTMLYLAAQGDDGLSEYEWRSQPASKKAKASQSNTQVVKQEIQKQITEGFRIYFPSFDTVRASAGGPNNGGTICFQTKWWNSPTFPRDLLRDCKSKREGMLMHNK
ncbi:MAG: hypothetical protein Q9166_008226, partial [cf. Caloplaca sp. 2 TL-2023]